MTTTATQPIAYSVTDEGIANLREQLKGITAKTPYKDLSKAISVVRTLRGEVETTRKALKKDALEYGRAVDAEAKRITTALRDIEDPIKAIKRSIDEEKARKKREAEEAAAKAKREAEEAERAERQRLFDEQQAAAKAEREAEEARLAQEREALKAEREALDAERAKIEAEKAERRAAQEAEERAEREAVEAEERRIRAEQIRPDAQKAIGFCKALEDIEGPQVRDAEVRLAVASTLDVIADAAARLRSVVEAMQVAEVKE